MASIGKCWKCTKTVYSTEGFSFGPPSNKVVSHKGCFRCAADGCNWKLELGTYKSVGDGKAYCKNHCPMTGKGDLKQQSTHLAVQTESVPGGATGAPTGSGM